MDDLTPSPRPADEAATDAELVGLVQSLPAGSTPRERAFETLIVRYRPMVRSCVRRYQTPPELADELMQAGYLGLMKAISNFDPDVGASLPAYAQPCISGEIKRYFRDQRSPIRIQRPLQELRQEIRAATAVLTQELGRAPQAAELAGHLDVSEATGHRGAGRQPGLPCAVPGRAGRRRGRCGQPGRADRPGRPAAPAPGRHRVGARPLGRAGRSVPAPADPAVLREHDPGADRRAARRLPDAGLPAAAPRPGPPPRPADRPPRTRHGCGCAARRGERGAGSA